MNTSVLESESRFEKQGFEDVPEVSRPELFENVMLRSDVRHLDPVAPWFLAWEQWRMRMGLLPQSHEPVNRSGLYTDFD